MKGFNRQNQLFSLCGLNCGLCPMFLNKTVLAAAAMKETRHAKLQDAAWSITVWNTAFSVMNTLVQNMSILTTMILL